MSRTTTLVRAALGSALIGAVGLLALLGWQSRAEACGGFFCSQTQPVNQAAERIIFVDHEDGRVSALVQILYEGPTRDFSWLLPVPGIPEVGVSSNIAFTRLQSATNPQYNLQTQFEGECDQFAGRGGVPTSADAGSAPQDDGGVSVLEEGSVGPYDYQVISVDPETPDSADAAVAWLERNGYDVTDIGPDLIRPYLDEGMNLLGFRLTSGATSGEIRPVLLTYETDLPMIPIKLTAVAANDDMGVLAWVVGGERAVPSNYFSLELNEAAINWLSPNSNYNDVVNMAADEAGGQGFVTEYAAPTSDLGEVVWSQGDSQQFAFLVDQDWSENRLGLVDQVIALYANYDGLRESLRDELPLPEGVSLDEVLTCFRCYYLTEEDLEGLDADSLLEAIADDVTGPMVETQTLLASRAYVTRLYTTMSARDMTLDPCFDFNPDLSDVSNIHTATRTIECSPNVAQSDAPWRVDLPQGDQVRGVGQSWPFTVEDMPANREIRQVGTSGSGQVIRDNRATIQQALAAHNATVPAGAESGCACRSAEPSGFGGAATGIGLLVFGWVLTRRRRSA